VKSKSVVPTSSKRSVTVTTVDNVERVPQRHANDGAVAVSVADRSSPRTHSHVKHPAPQTSEHRASGRSTPRSTPDHQARQSSTGGNNVPVDSGARGKRRPVGVDRGSDSDTRRRDVRFAEDTIVQTADGRAVIVDDSSAAVDRHPSHSRPSQPLSGTLPARLRGQSARQTLPELNQRDSIDGVRVVHRSTQRGQTRPLSAVFDDDDRRPGPPVSSSVAGKTGSVPASINFLHRGNSASVAKSRKVNVIQPAARRPVDANYYRDSASVRVHRR